MTVKVNILRAYRKFEKIVQNPPKLIQIVIVPFLKGCWNKLVRFSIFSKFFLNIKKIVILFGHHKCLKIAIGAVKVSALN